MDQAPATIYDTSAVIELRQSTLHRNRREELIDLFDRQLLAPQEATGMRVLGQFRDADDPRRFVWLRGFRDMSSRAAALQAFYGGPLWKANRGAANATMVDADDVLLLRPVDASAGFTIVEERPLLGAARQVTSLIIATIYLLEAPADDDFNQFFESRVRPLLAATGADPIARLRTEYAENNFPALPVRKEHAFVWFSSFASAADYERHGARLRETQAWHPVQGELDERLKSPAQPLRLEATARSRLGHVGSVPSAAERTGDVRDFDFLAGAWTVANRRLKVRGANSHEWEEFPATSRATLHLGGVANVDEIAFPTKGWSGMTVRVFNLEKHQWSIYWINSNSGVLFPPVVGGFRGNRGEFYGEDEDGGRPVKVRFIWTRRGPDAARWEQAFSPDGRTWETNWVMELTRAAP